MLLSIWGVLQLGLCSWLIFLIADTRMFLSFSDALEIKYLAVKDLVLLAVDYVGWSHSEDCSTIAGHQKSSDKLSSPAAQVS